ncbi:MAG: hypothetical protein ACTSSE_16010 [Candidatus Thorarchaeota archaeon]
MEKNETTALATTLAQDKELAQIFMDSGLFKDTKAISQAIVKIMAGRQIGLDPFESMSGLNIISGNITLSGNVQAAKIKENPKYDYRIIQANSEICEIDFFQDGEKIGISTYTIEEVRNITFWDKKAAKTKNLTEKDNWKNYPSDMLFNRAISRGRRRFTPDVFGCFKVYDPEELGDDGSNEPINITPQSEKPKTKPKSDKNIVSKICTNCNGVIPKDSETGLCASCTTGKKDVVIDIPKQSKEEKDANEEFVDAEFEDKTDDIEEDINHDDPDDKECPEICGTAPGVEPTGEAKKLVEATKESIVTHANHIIPEGTISSDMTPREALSNIQDYAMNEVIGDKVKPVIIEYCPEYADDRFKTYHIPESAVAQIVEELSGMKLKRVERARACKTDGCGNKMTKPEAEEQVDDDGKSLCRTCFDKYLEES